MHENIKGEDVLGLLKEGNNLGPYVVLGNIHSVDFLDNVEKNYEKFRKKEILAIRNALDEGDIENNPSYMELIRELELSELGRCGERGVDTHMHNNREWFAKLQISTRGKNVDIIYCADSKTPGDDFGELSDICDAAVRNGANSLSIYAPFVPCQREDKKDEGRVAISAKRIFNQLSEACSAKLERIVTSDLHSGQAQGFIDRPVDNLYTINLFVRYLKSKQFKDKHGNFEPSEWLGIGPDYGSAKRTRKASELLGIDHDIVDKARSEHGEISEINVGSIAEKLFGKNIIIFEDMIDTYKTLVESIQKIRSYDVRDIFVCAPHLIMSPRYAKENRNWTNQWHLKIESYAEDYARDSGAKVITTDSIPTSEGIPRNTGYYQRNRDWLDCVLSLAPTYAFCMLANRITNGSVSYLFEKQKKEIEECKFGEIDMSNEIIFQ